jgi:hypothetical protein
MLLGSAGFQFGYQEAEEDGTGHVAAGQSNRLTVSKGFDKKLPRTEPQVLPA